MSSASIRAKIQSGLSKAVVATGGANVEKVYLITRTNTGGNSPLNPPVISESQTELVNAIFKSYSKNLIGGNIQSGDRELLSDHAVEVLPGSIIRQGTTEYIVIPSDVVAPTSDVLMYKSQCRVQ